MACAIRDSDRTYLLNNIELVRNLISNSFEVA